MIGRRECDMDDPSNDIREWALETGRKLVDIITPLAESLRDLFDSLEPYRKHELFHPRKKPRGSVRRKKKGG